MTVSLRHPHTGEIKILPEGWSWACCLGVGILGMPLFRRGLPVQGALMVAFNMVALTAALVQSQRAAMLNGWLTVIWVGLSIFYGMKANEMVVNRYLALGWQRAGPGRDRA